MPGQTTKTECARTALLQAQQYLGTNSTLYAPRWSSKNSLINSNAPYLVTPSTSAQQKPERIDYRSHPHLWCVRIRAPHACHIPAPVTVDLSSDDDAALSSDSNHDFSPILLAPGFQPASVPPPGNMLVPLAQQENRWLGSTCSSDGPSICKISSWNSNPNRSVCKQIVNFTVFCPDDSSSGPHCLSLDNYNIDADNDSPNSHMVAHWTLQHLAY